MIPPISSDAEHDQHRRAVADVVVRSSSVTATADEAGDQQGDQAERVGDDVAGALGSRLPRSTPRPVPSRTVATLTTVPIPGNTGPPLPATGTLSVVSPRCGSCPGAQRRGREQERSRMPWR